MKEMNENYPQISVRNIRLSNEINVQSNCTTIPARCYVWYPKNTIQNGIYFKFIITQPLRAF